MSEDLENLFYQSENNKKEDLSDTFEFNEDIVVTPKEGDLVLSDSFDGSDEWAFFPMKNQFKKEFKTVLLFNSDEKDDFIKKFVKFFSRNYPNLKPSVSKIDMKAYDYFKEEPEFSDVVFIKVTPEVFNEKWKIVKMGPFGFNNEKI